jgi:hypothetical protein
MLIAFLLQRLILLVDIQRSFSNEIDPITPDVGAGLADKSSYGESGEALLGFGYKSSNGKSNLISLY